jgi:2-methylcitrate dehydratase PrpD
MIMTAVETLGKFFAQPRLLPAGVRDLVKLHIADTVAAWVTGARTPDGRQLRDLRTSVDGHALDAAVAVHCATTRMTEIDDIHVAAMITPGSIVVPAVLSIAASQNASGEAICRAIMAGYETMIRFGLAINGPMVMSRGVWATYFAAPVGVAAATASLMGLDGRRTAHALASALPNSASGIGKVDNVVRERWFAIGEAAVIGFHAARAAATGTASALDLLENGFFKTFHDLEADTTQFTKGLGERAMLSEVAFKPWCAARQTMAATQAFREMASRIEVAGIEQVEVNVQPVFLRMLDHGIEDGDRLSRLTSMPFQIAIAALDSATAFDVAQTSVVPDAVRAFMCKVKVLPNEDLMEGFPQRLRGAVRVRASGIWHEHETLAVPGDPAQPFDEVAIRQKFQRISRLPADTCDELISCAFGVIDGDVAPSDLLHRIESAT